VRTHVERGDLVEVLCDWSPKLPGWFLYYPNRATLARRSGLSWNTSAPMTGGGIPPTSALRPRPMRSRMHLSTRGEKIVADPVISHSVRALLAGCHRHVSSVRLDVVATDDRFDTVARKCDASVKFGEAIAQNVVAVPASADQRQVSVAAPEQRQKISRQREMTGIVGGKLESEAVGGGLAVS
jgi:hypothetical protein